MERRGAGLYGQKFCIVNRYDLSKEFPIQTIRKINFKRSSRRNSLDLAKKSNRIAELSSHIWDEWAGEDGTIGKAYGYQLAKKSQYAEGEFDQVDRVLF